MPVSDPYALTLTGRDKIQVMKLFKFKVGVLGESESREDLNTNPHFRFPVSHEMGRHIMLALN